jgi:hypothetical protein
VKFVDGSTFADLCGFVLKVEAKNEFFVIESNFLIDVKQDSLVRYFGSDSIVTITGGTKIVGPSCLRCVV